MKIPDQFSVLTSVIALAAFLLSLYNFYIDRRDKTSKLIIKLTIGNMKKLKENIDLRAFYIEVVNTSQINVFVTEAFVLLGRRKFRLTAENVEDVNFKTKVSPNEIAVFWVSGPTKDVVNQEQFEYEVKARAYVRDSLGKTYKSKVLAMHKDDFTN
jgi:hypothetical protein